MIRVRGKHATDCVNETFGPFTVRRRAGSYDNSSSWWCVDSRTGQEVIKTKRELMRVKRRKDSSCDLNHP